MATQNPTKAPAADAAAPANKPPEEVVDFASVFDAITSEEGDGAKPGLSAPAAAGAAGDGTDGTAGAASAAAGSAAAESAGAAAAGTDAAAGGEAGAAASVTPEPDSDAAKLAAAQARIAQLEAAEAAAAKKSDAAPAADADGGEAKPATEGAAPDPLKDVQWRKPNDKEGAVLENFRKEWPEVAEALAVQSQIDIYNAVQYTFAMVKKDYGERMNRLEQVAEVVGEMATLSDLRGRNKDYDESYDNVVQWTDTLIGFQKKAAKSVLENGTPEEVTELFAEYRKAHPQAPVLVTGAVATPTAAPQAPKGKTELSAAAKKAANALSVVDSKRTTATTAVDPNDFDAAWREATAN